MIQPFLLVIAGPNGAGKTTLISYLLRHNVDFGMFISPDEIAPGIRLTNLAASATEKYLWVIGETDVPYALELLPGVTFERGRLSHTNLTGGAPGHMAGELWFADESSIIVNGGSGRYPPRAPEELEAVASSFKACGFRVASMGWDSGAARARRFLRGAPTWL